MASSKARQRKLARAKMERQLARRAAKVRRQRQGWAIAVVSVVAVLGIAGTAWALGAFDKAKPKPAAASCTWNDTGGNATELKDVGKPPETGQQRTGTETMTITTNLGPVTAALEEGDHHPDADRRTGVVLVRRAVGDAHAVREVLTTPNIGKV